MIPFSSQNLYNCCFEHQAELKVVFAFFCVVGFGGAIQSINLVCTEIW
jgi:hypothetical protein